jgi:hypothetical protein
MILLRRDDTAFFIVNATKESTWITYMR